MLDERFLRYSFGKPYSGNYELLQGSNPVRGMRDCGGNCGIAASIEILGITARVLGLSFEALQSDLNTP